MRRPRDNDDTTLTCPSEREITTTRTFDAPRDRVFDAHTRGDLLEKWWGVGDTVTIVEEMDLRPGGTWRLVERAPDGSRTAVGGGYLEVNRPELFVYTFAREAIPDNTVVNRAEFEAVGDRTKVRITSLFSSQAQRDEMLETMERGFTEEYRALDDLLADWDSSDSAS